MKYPRDGPRGYSCKYAFPIFLADSIIGQKDRKVNYGTVLYHHRPGDPCGNAFLYPLMGKLAFSAPIKCPLYSPVAFGKRFFLYKSTGPYSYIGRLFFSVYIAFQTVFPVWFLPGSSSDPEIYGRPGRPCTGGPVAGFLSGSLRKKFIAILATTFPHADRQ